VVAVKIGIKYCGGCNPRYDRKRIAEQLKERFSHSFETADAENEYDLLVVLCGCSSGCAGYSQYKVKSRQVVILRSEADFDDAVNAIIKKG
jgi:4-hydroxybutyrate CoA-transferase